MTDPAAPNRVAALSKPQRRFTDLLDRVYMRHNNVVPLMALGVAQMKEDLGSRYSDENFPEIHQFLDRFYMSRIGIRMLIGQHISLHTPKEQQKEDHIGLICTKLSPLDVAHAAIAGASRATPPTRLPPARKVCAKPFALSRSHDSDAC